MIYQMCANLPCQFSSRMTQISSKMVKNISGVENELNEELCEIAR